MAGREEIGNNQPQALNSLLVKMDEQKALGVAAPGAFALPRMELILFAITIPRQPIKCKPFFILRAPLRSYSQ
jgi:hypothetical protein